MTGDPEAAEWIEREAWMDALGALAPEERAELGIATHRVGSAAVLTASRIDHVLFNRTLGLGVEAPADEPAVDEVLRCHRAAGVDRFFVQLSTTAWPQSIARWLEARGLARYHRAWVKLVRGTLPVAPTETSLEVRRATPADAPAVGAILTTGFEMPPASERVFSAVVGRSDWHAYVACHDGEPVSAALLFVRGDVANLTGAATLPAFRRRGAQGALMARRIADALDLGCRMIVSETGEKVPGDPQHSYRNMVRFGLRPAAVRDNYAPVGFTWSRPGAGGGVWHDSGRHGGGPSALRGTHRRARAARLGGDAGLRG